MHVNRPLTQFTQLIAQDQEDFIADKVFKTIYVDRQSDLYYKYLREYWFKAGAKLRAPASESAGGGFKYALGQYFCRKWAYHIDVPDEDYANADDVIDIDQDVTANLMQNMLLRKEKIFQTAFFKRGVWTGLAQTSGGVTTAYDFAPAVGTSGGSAGSGGTAGLFGYGNGLWNTSSSNPILDMTNLRLAALNNTGKTLNTLVVTADVDAALTNNAAFLGRITGGATTTNPAFVNQEMIARAFGIKNYYVAKAVLNTAQEGLPGVYNFMSSNSALFCNVPDAPGKRTPAAGYTFAWKGLLGAGAMGIRVKKFRMEHLESDRIEAEMAFDMNMIGSDLGIYMTNLLH